MNSPIIFSAGFFGAEVGADSDEPAAPLAAAEVAFSSFGVGEAADPG